MNSILLSAEHDLRSTGALSDETCRAFAQSDATEKDGFEASFVFLGCPSRCDTGEAVATAHRVAAIRLMMLRVGAHTSTPRWSSRMLDELVAAALRPSGATIGDLVCALFSLLAECPPGISDTQATLLREVGVQVVGLHRRAWELEDFSWLATAVANRNSAINAAQAYLAAYIMPPSLAVQCRDAVLLALHLTRFEDEVRKQLED